MSRQLDVTFLYNEFSDALFAYGRHLGFAEDTVMDAIHDVFYKICIDSESFKEISNLKFYLFRMLKNRLIDIQRTNREYAGSEFDDQDVLSNMSFKFTVSVEDEFIEAEDREEIKQKIDEVLNKLTNRQREIVYLRYIHEYSYEEIAQIMQISVVSCRNLISKAISKLKDSSLSLAALLLIIRGLVFVV